MKKFAAILFLMLYATTLIHGQKTRLSQTPPKAAPLVDYPLKAHVSASHLHYFPTSGVNYLYVDAILDGKKVELKGWPTVMNREPLLLTPGDYKARVTKDIHSADSKAFYQEYEVLLSDGSFWRCAISGLSE